MKYSSERSGILFALKSTMTSNCEHKPATIPEYYASLDGIRGVLALVIAIFHTAWASHIGHESIMRNAPAVVDIFFVLSGFIMYRLYGNTLRSKEDGLQYLKKRVARLYPLHFFMLIIMTAYALFRIAAHYIGIAHLDAGEILPFQPGSLETLGTFVAHLSLTHSIGVTDGLSFNHPSWSISVEFFAYIVFVIMVLNFKPSKVRHFGFMAALVGLTYYVLSRLKPDMDFHYDLGFFRCLAGFFTGVLSAWALGTIRPKLKSAEKTRNIFTLLETVFGLAMLGFIAFAVGKAQFFVAPLAFLVVTTFALDRGAISDMLSHKIPAYLGKISYSIYMIHFPIALGFAVLTQQILPRVIGPDWNTGLVIGNILMIAYLAIVISISHVTYHWIEVRGRKALLGLKRPLSARLKPWVSAP